MSKNEFVHLHVHSDYSFLDGAAPVKGLAERAAKLGMKALALTDHGVMCGLMEFKKACEKVGVKPILGSEIYVVPHRMQDKKPPDDAIEGGYSHLVLLATSDLGYQNLTKIVSRGFKQGFYRKPRVDYETLDAHSEGLIALTACLGGEIPRMLMKNRPELAAEKALRYQEIFGKGNFYLEVQNHKNSQIGRLEQRVAEQMFELADQVDIPLVLTNDSHYLNPEDFHAHNVALCISTGKRMSDERRLEYGPDFYLKDQDEMASLFPGREDILRNTVEIAERCYSPLKRDQQYFLPHFECPDIMEPDEYMERLCLRGLEERYGKPTPIHVLERFRFEFETIKNMGFISYFLITADFINWAKERGIPVGPGRGSAAGSIISYALGITSVDPLKYNLLFERFLNPDRISMPDIDIDFCQERRGEVIEYVKQRYGEDCVCQIGTFNKLLSRAVLKDVGRVMDFSVGEINAMTKQIEVKQGRVPSIEDILRTNDVLRTQYDENERIQGLWDTAKTLEGIIRGTGVHAAGVVIAPSPVEDFIPLMRQKDDEEGDVVIATQYTMTEVEDQGLLKMDFLGLGNLTIIDRALRLIEKDTGVKVDIDNLPLDDEKTYESLSRGEGFGVFQLESEGMCKLLRSVKPTTFEDISAVLAIYRPGPLSAGVDKQFAARKSGKEKVVMPGESEGLASKEAVEKLLPILSDTYGLLIYQEQAMMMSRELAAYTPGKADLLRKAIGKKNEALMNELRPQFVDGCEKNGYGKALGEHLWALMEGFGAYGFNKSHTVAYGMITYQTAWLKANYPVQYAAALVSCAIGNNDKVIWYVRRIRESGTQVLPPDINRSDADFSTYQDAVVFGLSGMKGAGTKAIESLLEARKAVGGRFKGFMHFLENVDHSSVTRSVIEALIRGGAFDSFELKRAALIEGLDAALKVASQAAADKARGQANLFGGASSDDAAPEDEHQRDLQVLPNVPEWTEREIQRAEKEAFGFYITTSPLDSHLDIVEAYRTHTSDGLQNEQAGRHVVLGGMIRAIKVRKVRNEASRNYGREMADIELQDPEGVVRITAFPDQYEAMGEHLIEDSIVFLRGVTEERDDEIGLTLLEVVPSHSAKTRFADDPLLKYGRIFKAYCQPPAHALIRAGEGSSVTIAGVASNVMAKTTKKGKPYLMFTLVSTEGSARVMCFSRTYEAAREVVRENAALYVKGTTTDDERSATLFADEVTTFEDAQRSRTGAVCVRLNSDNVSKPVLENLRGIITKYRGDLPLYFKLHNEDETQPLVLKVTDDFGVSAAPQFFTDLESTFGDNCYEVVAK